MKDLSTGKVGLSILKFTLPMLAGSLLQMTYNIVDSMLVGQLIGKEALGAVGASFPVIYALISFVIGIASGGTIVISQYFGAKNYNKVCRAIDTMYMFVFGASVLITIIGITFSYEIFQLIHLPEEVIPQATEYLNTFLLGTILLFGFNGTSAILRGLGDSKTPLVFLILATLLNIILDYIFIKYLHLGVRGAALATVISQGVTFFGAIFYLNKFHELVRLKIKEIRFDLEVFKQSARIGLPSGFQQTFVSFGMIALFRLVNEYGTDVIAAYTVAGRIDNFAILPAMNFGQALGTFVGQNIGANKLHRIRSGLIRTLIMSSVLSLIVTAIILLFRTNIMHWFTDDQNVIQIGAGYLKIVSLAYLLFSILFTINGVLRGSGATIIPMFITLFSLWIIRIPFAYFLSEKLGMEYTGIWLAVPLAWGAGTICSFFYYLSGRWKTKGVINHSNEKDSPDDNS